MTSPRLGYNSNGFPQHRLPELVDLLADLGYEALALTPDAGRLDPCRPLVRDELREVGARLSARGLACAVETGARFVLDPLRKHQPTLLDDDAGEAERRLEMLLRCLEIAAGLGAETFSFWAGRPLRGLPCDGPSGTTIPGERASGGPSFDALLDRLCAGTERLLDAARGSGVTICFEPEPGMLVASLPELDAYLARLGRDDLRVMLDVGHVPVTDGVTPHEALRRLGPRLGGLQLDDARPGVHEHLFPGEGVVDFAAVFAAAREAGFAGLACVELPRHGHDPVETARRALHVLREARQSGEAPGAAAAPEGDAR
ncbi:MAG: sugar phosphate isomerase/epimerase [Planctomycetes bacterium]|nr:sugar phosphate isomerase/epimerase [Planctomycetota bacterium]